MEALTVDERIALINDMASRAYTIKALAINYNMTVREIKAFFTENKDAVEAAAQALTARHSDSPDTVTGDAIRYRKGSKVPSPSPIGDLWLAQKAARLTVMQVLAEHLFEQIMAGLGDATSYREFRYLLAQAANELGQFMNRGTGEATEQESLGVNINGIDLESLK